MPKGAASTAGMTLGYEAKAQTSRTVVGADEGFREPVTDFWLPLVLLGGGMVVEVCAAWWGGPRGASGLAGAMREVGLGVVAGTVLTMVAVWIATKARGIEMGKAGVALLKLAALSVGPGSVMTVLGTVLSHIPFGGLVNWGIGFCLYFALLGVFFDLDQEDTWYVVMVIFVVRIFVALGAFWLMKI